MKDATSEVSASVIVISAVAVLTVVFFMVIWPAIKQGFKEDANCANAVCDSGYIPQGEADEGQAYCYNPQDDSKEIFTCPYRG